MPFSQVFRLVFATCIVLVSNVLMGTPVRAGEWAGSSETRDGVEYVSNPATPMDGAVTITLEELWRVGGFSDAEGEFFGVINQVAVDADENVYLLDRQLNEVKVFSPAGEYLRTIGREGEGPGEFRQALDMFFLANGNLGVLQLAPGRIVLFTREGDPAGDYPLPVLTGGGSPSLVSGRAMGEQVLLVVSTNAPQENRIDITRALILVDGAGVEQKKLLESVRPLEFVDFEFEESVWVTFDNRWSVAPGGGLYAVEHFLDYRIIAWDRDGNRVRVIEREYEHLERSRKQKQEQHDIFDGFLQNQLPKYSIKISDHDADITQLYPRQDGTLWVLTSHGTRGRPEGSLGVFDVFDAQGHFLQQVTLMGAGDPMGDGYYFFGDRLYVVTDQLDADLASRGGRVGEDDAPEDELEDEPEPISVICYRIDLAGE